MAQATLGFSTAFSDNVGGPLPTFIWGFAIEVEEPSYATALGFISLAPPLQQGSADAHIALYRDSAGVPAELIVAMDRVDDLPPQTPTEFAQTLATPEPLQPGIYWLMGKAISPISPFASDLVFNGGFPAFPMAAVEADADQPFPQNLANVQMFNSHAPNFYLEILAPES